MSLNIVLYEPEIPTNTGNIARTCAATNTALHLIRPLGFSTDDKMLKRAGLDYWKHVAIHYYDSLDHFFQSNQGQFFYVTKHGEQTYSDGNYSQLDEAYYFMFGKETGGLPEELIATNRNHCLRLPMTQAVRTLNLANSVAIIIYEALRQQNYPHVT